MNGREPLQPIKSQLIEISFGGKTYKICSKGQMNYIMAIGLNEIMRAASGNQKQLSEDQVQEELKKYKENCGYAILNDLLEQVSPEERERWKNNYRFSGVIKKSGE